MRIFFLIMVSIPYIGFSNDLENIDLNDSLESVFSISAQQHYGFIIIHSRAIRAIKNSYPIGTEFNFNWQKIDKTSWDLCHCYPRVGGLVSFFDFDNKHILGYGFNVAGFIEPFFRTDKKLNISFRLVAGLSFATKPYNQNTNPKNLSYSLPVNEYSQLGMILHYKFNPRFKATFSTNYNHISNGGLKQPNKGINYPTLGVGVDFTPNPVSFSQREKTDFNVIKKRRYDLSISYFPKKIISNSRYFTVFGVSTGISQQIGKISALTFDLECIWDHSLKWRLEQLNEDKNFFRGGSLVGHEFLMGRFTFSQKLGVYIYDVLKYNNSSLYQKYGINFHVSKNIFVGLHVKSHRHVADFMLVKLGWTF